MIYKEQHYTVKCFICASLNKTHSEVCPLAFAEDPKGSIVSIY